MSERENPNFPDPGASTSPTPPSSPSSSSPMTSTFRILFQSIAIIIRHRLHFLATYALTALPLSLLLFSLAISAHPIEIRVRSLESLARLSPTRFESRQILKESRSEALSALRLRAAYSLPCLVLSIAALASSAQSTSAAVSGRRPALSSAVAAVRERWLRALVTTICVYASMWGFLSVTATLRAALAELPGLRFLAFLIGSALEVYLMAVLGVAMVVTVLEERVGFDALRASMALVTGRRWVGFVLSCIFVLMTGSIWRVLEGSMDGQDWTSLVGMVRWMVGIGWRAWLVPLYGLLVLWSYVVLTVFYCHCRRRNSNVSREREGESEMALVDTL
ncbi:hypothetical protein SAY86_014650 [Trapa natans]|uniref:Transmembrane protein n=1 Tax=Trapa natans TaxID=22666 RepID=A0AAN7KG94_TRANT|nr:hypothetical protein SAY86_014650 [Trapa natans]